MLWHRRRDASCPEDRKSDPRCGEFLFHHTRNHTNRQHRGTDTKRRYAPPPPHGERFSLDSELDRLADIVENALDMSYIHSLITR